VKPGDQISVVEKSRNQLRIQEALTLSQEMDLAPAWTEVDAKQFVGTLKALPERSDLPSDINESLIVELYSK
jgi:small subunit ribosomal protein S4